MTLIKSKCRNCEENINFDFDTEKIKIMNDEFCSLISKKYQIDGKIKVIKGEIRTLEQHINSLKSMCYKDENFNNLGIILLGVICTITGIFFVSVLPVGLILLTIAVGVLIRQSFIKKKYRKLDELFKSKNNEFNLLLKERDDINCIIEEIRNIMQFI